ncbi:MAG TPA: flagellar motor protein MotB [Opitutus sp.]|nr:flagellar motor protein MotB [Opitutus sp.]
MKTSSVFVVTGVVLIASFASGCATQPAETRITNPKSPGPAVGHAVGSAVGAVAGGVAGAVVGGAEGATAAAKAPFKNERRTIRTWRTETTADGRTIQVPVETEVDEYGRPIGPATTPATK